MRYAAKTDDNQAEIVKALRAIGCFVQSLAMVGKGCPDILVGYRGKWRVIEIKDGAKPPSARKLTPAEQKWRDDCEGKAPYEVAISVDEAIEIVTGGRDD